MENKQLKMNKEELLIREAEISKKIEQLANEKKMIREQYVQHNAEFEIGEKVKVFKSKDMSFIGLGVINKRFISYNHSIKYTVSKVKKDGEVGKTSYPAYWDYKLEKV